MYKISQFAEKVGVSVQTLRLWHKKGKLLPECITVGGQRLYSEAQVNQFRKRGMADTYIIGFMDGIHDDLVKSFLCAKGSRFFVEDDISKVINKCHVENIVEVVLYDRRYLNNHKELMDIIQSWGIIISFVENEEGRF